LPVAAEYTVSPGARGSLETATNVAGCAVIRAPSPALNSGAWAPTESTAITRATKVTAAIRLIIHSVHCGREPARDDRD
jgi:hypothetical protein